MQVDLISLLVGFAMGILVFMPKTIDTPFKAPVTKRSKAIKSADSNDKGDDDFDFDDFSAQLSRMLEYEGDEDGTKD